MEDRFGRAKIPAAPELVGLLESRARAQSYAVASYYCQVLIHRAHVVMLVEKGILSKDEGRSILEGIREVAEAAKKDDRMVSYMATESELITRIGEVGGKMHIGRSRNDLAHTQQRIFYRDQIERIVEALIQYRRALTAKAEENLESIMPGYTHWRQAQPVTLGHYLIAHVDAAGRSLDRLLDLYERTNLSPLGAAALAGTGWPIDRKRTMELLGFTRLCENTYDGVAAHDYVIELACALAIHMCDLSRLAEDLQIWSSDEFAMIDLDESFAGTSSIMPQKKNPSSLELVKKSASEVMGALVMALTSVKGASYTNVQDRAVLEPVTIETVSGCTKVMAGVVSTLVPLREIMLLRARQGFSSMTDLADALVRSHGLTFRQAHEIIAGVASEAIALHRRPEELTVGMIEEAAAKHLGKELRMDEEELRSAVDPVENVKRRNGIGGPAPEEVRRMIEARKILILQEEESRRRRLKRIQEAAIALEKAEAAIGVVAC